MFAAIPPRHCCSQQHNTRKTTRKESPCTAGIELLRCLCLPHCRCRRARRTIPTGRSRRLHRRVPGGLSDLFMRALGDQMGPALGTSIVVEDRTGAEGTIGAKACADAAPDGYTICILPGETLVINPLIYPSDFDPFKALVPVARPYYLTQVFAVNASLGVKTFPELAALVKSKPKTFNYMAPSLSKVAFMEQFNKKNGTDIVRVPFKGGGDAVTSMLNGTTQIAIFGIGNLVSFIRDGKVGRPCHRRRQAFAAGARHSDLQGSRLHRAYRRNLLRHLCARGYAAADHRQTQPSHRRSRIQARFSGEIPDKPRPDAGPAIGGAIRQGTAGRSRRGPLRGESLWALS